MFKNMEKYIANLSPELQEKARNCKNMDELKKLIAENDIELPEDVLQAVAGGAGGCTSSTIYLFQKGDPLENYMCPVCGEQLYCDGGECDSTQPQDLRLFILYLNCNNSNCAHHNKGLRWTIHLKDIGSQAPQST